MPKSASVAAIGIALTAIFLSTGCGRAPTVHYSQVYNANWPSFFAHSEVTDEVRTRIGGTPVSALFPQRNSVVLHEFQRAFHNPGFQFVTEPVVEARGRPYLSVIFTGPGYPRSNACLPYATLSPPPAGAVHMQASLCRGSAPLTTVGGSVMDVTGPDDPRVRALIRRVAFKTFETPLRSGRDVSKDP